MKMTDYCLIAMIFFIPALSQASDRRDHVGDISPIQLIEQFGEFSSSYQAFEVDQFELAALRAINDKVTIVALFGTWCHDSKREVPRLIKLLEAVANSNIVLTLKAVGRDKKGLDESFKFKYTPTFIIYRQDVEIGRIVERPKLTLTEDLTLILQNAGNLNTAKIDN